MAKNKHEIGTVLFERKRERTYPNGYGKDAVVVDSWSPFKITGIEGRSYVFDKQVQYKPAGRQRKLSFDEAESRFMIAEECRQHDWYHSWIVSVKKPFERWGATVITPEQWAAIAGILGIEIPPLKSFLLPETSDSKTT